MELMHGSPGDMTGRQDREIRAYRLLDSLGVDFWRVDHPEAPSIATEVFARAEAALGTPICKNLFLCNRQKTDFYLLIMPGDKPFKTKELSHQLGVSRLSFADEACMLEYLDLTPGSVSVLGLMNDRENRVHLVIDGDVLAREYFACHPCRNTSSLKFLTSELTEKILPAVGHGYTAVHLTGED